MGDPVQMVVGGTPDGIDPPPPSVGSTDATPPTSTEASTTTDTTAGRSRLVLAGLVAALVAIAFVVVDRVVESPPPTTVAAPDDPGDLRWSMEVGGGAESNRQGWQPLVVPVGDDLVVQRADPRASDHLLLERRDARTGDVTWSVSVPRRDVVVLVDGGDPVAVSQRPPDADTPTAVRAVAVDDGSSPWSLEASTATNVAIVDGELFASGAVDCGVIDTPTGQPAFLLDATTCFPVEDGILRSDGPDDVVVDARGLERYRAPSREAPRAMYPILAGEYLLRVEGATLVSRTTSGEARSDPIRGGPWTGVGVVGDHHVQLYGSDGAAVVVDLRTARVTARLQGLAVPVGHADASPRLFAGVDRDRVREPNTWSRSPDAQPIGLYDVDGDLLGTAALVLTSPPYPTADGILLAHGPDDARRLSLLSADDLAPTWELPLDLRFGQVVASTERIVAVLGDVDGRRRLDVFGPP